MIEYKETGKFAHYKGLRFTRDDNTGYYLNSTIRKRLHRYVWESEHGEIQGQLQVHHIDNDKGNNDISNLELISQTKHMEHHGNIRSIVDTEWFEDFYKKGVEKAKEWHASPEGIEWHKEHYQKNKYKLHQEIEVTCDHCLEVFKGKNNGSNRFCSNKCKSAWRRKSGVDDEYRVCEYCKKDFKTNKYSKTEVCGMSCNNRLRKLRKDKEY